MKNTTQEEKLWEQAQQIEATDEYAKEIQACLLINTIITVAALYTPVGDTGTCVAAYSVYPAAIHAGLINMAKDSHSKTKEFLKKMNGRPVPSYIPTMLGALMAGTSILYYCDVIDSMNTSLTIAASALGCALTAGYERNKLNIKIREEAQNAR